MTKERTRYIPQRVKDHVRDRDKGQCVYCNKKEKLWSIIKLRKMEYGHVIPHSKRGDNCINNIQLECFKCNRSKSDNREDQPRGFLWIKKGAKGCRRRCKHLKSKK